MDDDALGLQPPPEKVVGVGVGLGGLYNYLLRMWARSPTGLFTLDASESLPTV